MTTARFKMLAVLAIAFGSAAMGAGCNVEHGALDKPTYEADVQPIFMARCVRCHGSPPLQDPDAVTAGIVVSFVRFDRYADTNCDTDAGTACVHGAAWEAGRQQFMRVLALDQKTGGMPPSPAPALTSYQRDTILNWEAEAANGGTPLEK
jgi:hypothetical protein